jgi:hypothetical protein
MNKYFPLLVAACLTTSLFADQPKEKEISGDVTVENPPGVPVNPGTPGSKPKRSSKNTTQAVPRRGTSEIKTFSFNRAFSSERLTRPLIVRSGKADPKTTAQLQEDLAIMSRILEKSAADYKDDHEEAAGIPILALGGGKGIRAVYLEDYGVLFTVNVNIPLQPEPKMESIDNKPPGAANEEWNEARNELFPGPGRGQRIARREFDPHQFEEFRDSMIDDLRNAANIRNLRESDWITVVVRGRNPAAEVDGTVDLIVRSGYGTGDAYRPVEVGRTDVLTESSTMVLRIKKGQLDEFARKKGSAEEFKPKISLIVY